MRLTWVLKPQPNLRAFRLEGAALVGPGGPDLPREALSEARCWSTDMDGAPFTPRRFFLLYYLRRCPTRFGLCVKKTQPGLSFVKPRSGVLPFAPRNDSSDPGTAGCHGAGVEGLLWLGAGLSTGLRGLGFPVEVTGRLTQPKSTAAFDQTASQSVPGL